MLNQDQKFYKALALGIPFSIFVAVVYWLIQNALGFTFSYFIILIGIVIGQFIRNIGRGVQVRFSILACGLTIFTILLSGVLPYAFTLGIGVLPKVLALYFTQLISITNISNMIYLIGCVFSAYLAFNMGRLM